MASNLGKEIDWWCTGIAGLIAAFIAFVTFAGGGDRDTVMAVWVLAAPIAVVVFLIGLRFTH